MCSLRLPSFRPFRRLSGTVERFSGPSAVLLLPILSLLVGCAPLGFDPPDLTLVDLRLTEVTVLETSGTVTVRLANGNPDPIEIDGLAFDLKLDGRRVGKVLSDQRLEVPRLSSVTLDAELHLSHLAVATRLPQILEQESLSYSLSGKVFVLTDYGRRRLVIDKVGDVDFSEASRDDYPREDLSADLEQVPGGGDR